MRGLLVRLSTIDSDAERAVRIISFFDGLTRNNATHETLVRSAAVLAECGVGITAADGQVLAYLDANGEQIVDPSSDDHRNGRPLGPSGLGGYVWLDRAPGSEVDEMVLDRLAVAAEIILEQRMLRSAAGSDESALVRIVVNGRGRDLDRLRAAQSLSMVGPAMVVATSATQEHQERLAELKRRLSDELRVRVRAALMNEEVACLLVMTADADTVAAAILKVQSGRARSGLTELKSVIDAPAAWTGALRALRFAKARGVPAVQERSLGASALLADLPRELLLQVPDVIALSELALTPSGARVIEALDAVCHEGTLRKASVHLNLHHSSVASRLAAAEAGLGFSLSCQDGLHRARLALDALRIAGVSSTEA